VSPDPVLHLLAGPNGSGKTTLARRVIVPATHLPFINADDIAADRWPGAELEHAYDASEAASAERSRRLHDRSSFISETVFSHPSKVELVQSAQEAGYLVYLHVLVIPEELSVLRVAHRVRMGGHAVPEAKIRERYRRLWPLVAQARDLADLTYVYDNSTASRPHRLMASYELGRVLGKPSWAVWTPIELR
jgi:predicted ABC-type ATPase